jgi:ABC-type amino acid transport system permease subunit
MTFREEFGRRWTRTYDTLAAILVTVGIVGLLLDTLVARWGLDWNYMESRFGVYLSGAWITFYVTTVSYFVGMVIGFVLGWTRAARAARIKDLPIGLAAVRGVRLGLRSIGDGYVAIIRGTPLFVQIVFASSVLVIHYPELDPNTIAFIAGIVAMTANTGGYQSEIFRAGIQTVHAGQVEAARAIGFSRWGAMRHVVLPQALRLVVPPLTNEYIGLLKASSLLLVIGIVELTEIGRRESFFQGKPFESFAIVTGLYLLITVPVSKVIQYAERRFGIPGLGIQPVETTRV